MAGYVPPILQIPESALSEEKFKTKDARDHGDVTVFELTLERDVAHGHAGRALDRTVVRGRLAVELMVHANMLLVHAEVGGVVDGRHGVR